MKDKSAGVAIGLAAVALGIALMLALTGQFTGRPGGGGTTFLEEGSFVGVRPIINCIGAAVTCADNAASNRADITLTGGYATVQEEGTALTQRATINFVGSAATAADNPANSRTNVTFDADLNALASLSTIGVAARTATSTWAAIPLPSCVVSLGSKLVYDGGVPEFLCDVEVFVDEARPKGDTGDANFTIPGVVLSNTTTFAVASGTVYYSPFIVELNLGLDTERPVDELAIAVSGAVASTSCRVGVYVGNLDWQPTTLVVDAGTVSVATTGKKGIIIAFALTPGRYMTATVCNGTPTLRVLQGSPRGTGIEYAFGAGAIAARYFRNSTSEHSGLSNPAVGWNSATFSGAAPFYFVVMQAATIP